MIVVAGEALIDLVVGADGRVDAHPGGGPYNAARTLARLGVPDDLSRPPRATTGSAALLRERLAAEGVGTRRPRAVRPRRARWPSSPSMRRASPPTASTWTARPSPTWTTPAARQALPADADRRARRLPRPADGAGRHVHRAAALPTCPRTPSCCSTPTAARAPSPTTTPTAGAIGVIARRADIVKASVEDLAYLYPDVPPAGGGRARCSRPARRSSSSPTARARPARSCPAPSSPSRSPPSPSRTRSARVTRSAAASSPGGRRTASAGTTCATRNWSARALRAAAGGRGPHLRPPGRGPADPRRAAGTELVAAPAVRH